MYQTYPGVTAVIRPITETEKQALGKVLRPVKMNAIGLALVSMLMAVMINFVPDQWLVVVPIFFAFVALGSAIQARKIGGIVVSAMEKGTVADVRVSTVQKRAGGNWDLGAFSVPRNGALGKVLSEGSPASLCIVPDTKHLLSVNGAILSRIPTVNAYPQFATMLSGGVSQAPAQAQPIVQDQELPPPPDDWSQKFCAQCGQSMSASAVFCPKCGYKSKM
jgi:hypothetical protein